MHCRQLWTSCVRTIIWSLCSVFGWKNKVHTNLVQREVRRRAADRHRCSSFSEERSEVLVRWLKKTSPASIRTALGKRFFMTEAWTEKLEKEASPKKRSKVSKISNGQVQCFHLASKTQTGSKEERTTFVSICERISVKGISETVRIRQIETANRTIRAIKAIVHFGESSSKNHRWIPTWNSYVSHKPENSDESNDIIQIKSNKNKKGYWLERALSVLWIESFDALHAELHAGNFSPNVVKARFSERCSLRAA